MKGDGNYMDIDWSEYIGYIIIIVIGLIHIIVHRIKMDVYKGKTTANIYRLDEGRSSTKAYYNYTVDGKVYYGSIGIDTRCNNYQKYGIQSMDVAIKYDLRNPEKHTVDTTVERPDHLAFWY